MAKINCFLCQTPLEVLTSKKGKPYFICDDCGIQIFFRLPKGIRRLRELLKHGESLSDNFVFCRRCRVAVETCGENLQEPLLGKSGIYCPRCEELLLEISKKELERR